MHKLALVPIFVFFLGGFDAMVLDSPAHAKHALWHCCSCGMCDYTCYCRYQSPYCFCAVPDDEAIHPDHHSDETTVDIRGNGKPRAFNVALSNITERLQSLMAGERTRSNFALNVLGHFENGLKIWCPGSGEKVSSDNSVAFKLKGDETP